jgi:hypothetical protein
MAVSTMEAGQRSEARARAVGTREPAAAPSPAAPISTAKGSTWPMSLSPSEATMTT